MENAPNPAAGDGAVAENQPPPQGNSFFGVAKGLMMRAVVIYFITSFFRGQKPPTVPASGTGTGPDAVGKPSYAPSNNLYGDGTMFDLYVYLSENEFSPDFEDFRQLVWRREALIYGDWDSGLEKDGLYSTDVVWSVPQSVQNNGSFWMHTYIVRHQDSPNPDSKDYSPVFTLHKPFQMNRFKKRSYKKTTNLITGESAQSKEAQEKIDQNISQEILSHWHPNITINFIADQTMWTQGHVPAQIQEHFTFEPTTGMYKPIVYVNNYWNLARDYMPLNDTVEEMNLKITYQPMSLMKFQFYMAHSMRSKWSAMIGSDLIEQNEDEQDVLKETLLETSPILLGLTMVVSLTHSIFEILAFKNDIQFWKERRSLEGLSVRSVFFNVFQSLIVLLYVCDNDTNIMIRFSVGIGLLIELWKIKKVINIEINYEQKILRVIPRVSFSDKGSYVEASTRVYDQIAFKYLSWALFPCLLAYGVYSLIYNEHKGWYSFVLNMIYSFLLTFGFIMMTPQLFINYKLKSVAHLPWRMLTYKFLNTFIDDIFAFVIKMPTMYRLGCFRDDIIFLIYLYQRWVYRVDLSRVNEFGISGDDLNSIKKDGEEEEQKQLEEPKQLEETKKDK